MSENSSGKKISTRSVVLWILGGFFLLMIVVGVSGLFAAKSFMSTFESDKTFFASTADVAVIEIRDVIMDPSETLKEIEALEETPIKAVVVRISSPGGAVGPSQEIFQALRRLQKTKTVVCSFGDVAASGGYYIAMGCQKIVSNPGTLTGSIGVVMNFANIQKLYEWAKVTPYILKAGRFKDIGSPLRPMQPAEEALLQAMLDQVHKQFKEAVLLGRKDHLDEAVVEEFADGRILNGEEAKKLGFVDELGGEYEAIMLAAELAGISGKPKVTRQKDKFKDFRMFFDSEAKSNEKISLASIENLIRQILPATQSLYLKPGVPYFLPAHMLR